MTEQERKEIMLKALLDKADPHLEVAKVMFSTQTPTKQQRTTAKSGNFYLIYSGALDND